MNQASAIIADDEPLLRESLARSLAQLWPELKLVAQARNGREAVALFEQWQPDIVFLDVHMPGLNGVEAARLIARRAHLVFVTAFEQYAVQAFEQGALDYVVKPIQEARLQDTVTRLKERLQERRAPAELPVDRLAEALRRAGETVTPPWLTWIRASVGQTVRLIPVDEVHFLRSDEKYTLVVWTEGEALIRMPLREL
ncbi:MAG TPA: response regulator, partial [Burkholderiaceae bacterium]